MSDATRVAESQNGAARRRSALRRCGAPSRRAAFAQRCPHGHGDAGLRRCSPAPAATSSCSTTSDGARARRQRRRATADACSTSLGGAAGRPAQSHTLFNTHWHLDQIGGNEALGARRRDDRRAREDAAAPRDGLLRAGRGPLSRRPLPEAGAAHREHSTRRARRRSASSASSTATCSRRTPTATSTSTSATRTSSPSATPSSPRARSRARLVRRRLARRARRLAEALARARRRAHAFVPSYGPVIGRAEVQAEHDMMLKLFEALLRARPQGRHRRRHASSRHHRRHGPHVDGPGEVRPRRAQGHLGAQQHFVARYRIRTLAPASRTTQAFPGASAHMDVRRRAPGTVSWRPRETPASCETREPKR